MSNKSWLKLPEETSRQYAAFCLYRDMGPERSISDVANVWSDSGATSRLNEWSSKYNWVDRASSYDEHIDEIKRARNEEAIIEMSARHVKYSIQVQEKAIEALRLINPEELKPNEFIKWLLEAVKIERLSLGVPTENIKQENEVKEVRNDAITKESLEKPEVRKKANQLIRAIADSQSSSDGASTPCK
jgi:hypothetical protein